MPFYAAAANQSLPFSNPTSDVDHIPEPLLDDDVPDIEARSYEVRIRKRSESKRSYLVDDLNGARPKTGRIVLFKKGNDPIMAFRVLRSTPEQDTFIVKRVRRYSDVMALEPGEQYTAIDRTLELAMQPVYSADDSAEMRELMIDQNAAFSRDSGLAPDGLSDGLDDAALDSGASDAALDNSLDSGGNPRGQIGSSSSRSRISQARLDEDGDLIGESDYEVDDPEVIDDNRPFDRLKHSISAEMGLFKSETALGTPAYFTGLGVRYGLTLARMILFRRSSVQDSFVVEGGLFTYSLANYQIPADSYTVMPMVGTLRYNVFLNETIGIQLYGGISRNMVLASTDATDEALARLAKVTPAAGGGLIFKLGPHWDARVEGGVDMIGAGLMVSF